MTKRFSGLGVALITPFSDEGAIDFPGLEKMVHHVSGSKAHFLVVLGSTGEAQLMDGQEQRRVLDFVQEVNAGRLPVVSGFDGSGGTAAAVRRIEQMDTKGLAGLLVSPPPYIKPSQAALVAYYQALAEASPLPIIMYNVPSRAGVNMEPKTIIEVARTCPHIVALKQANDDMVAFQQIRAGVPQEFAMLSGDDVNAIPMMSLGGDGLVSVIGNAFPNQWAAAMDLASFGSVKEAGEMLSDNRALLDVLFDEGNPTGIKAVCNLMGLCSPSPRLPLLPASSALRTRLYQAMAEMDAVPTKAEG